MHLAYELRKRDKIFDYKGERKNDAAIIWLNQTDNAIAEQEELINRRFTDRQKVSHASRAHTLINLHASNISASSAHFL